jgi:hypothetical protein
MNVCQSECEDNWIATLATSGYGYDSRPPDRTRIIHQRADELLVKQHTVSDVHAAFLLRRGPSTLSLWAAFFPTWLACADQKSCVTRVTPRYCAVSTHCIGSMRNWTVPGFKMRLAVLTKSIMMLFGTLMAISYPEASAQVSRDKSPDNQREALDWGTWRVMPDRYGRMLYVCRIPPNWTASGYESTLNHTSPHATRFGCGWLEGRLERSEVKKWGYSFHKVEREALYSWLVKEPFCSKWCLRLYPHPENQCRFTASH